MANVKSDRIAIPELQRPFVWDSVKVRDLMDSLYKGYPVGYLITRQSVGAKLKGGQVAGGSTGLGPSKSTAVRVDHMRKPAKSSSSPADRACAIADEELR